MNWKLRLKRWDFWLAVFGAIIAASGIEPASLTTWAALGDAFIGIFANPFKLGGVILAVIGIFTDHTTAGLEDSELAKSYEYPKPKEGF